MKKKRAFQLWMSVFHEGGKKEKIKKNLMMNRRRGGKGSDSMIRERGVITATITAL